MKLNSLVRKNFSYLCISSISRLVANSILFIIIARFYGTEIFGSFSSSYTLSFLFTYIADYGFDVLITSEVAKNKNNLVQLISKYLPIKILLIVCAFSLFIISSFLIPSTNVTKIILFIFSFNIVISTLQNFSFSIFKGLERFNYEALISFLTNVTLLLVIIFLSSNKVSIFYVIVSIVFFKLIGLILAINFLRNFVDFNKIKIGFNLKEIYKDFKVVSLYGLDLLFGAIYLQIDTVILLSFKGEAETGLYQAVFRIAMMLFIFPDLIINTLFPTVVRVFHQKKDTWETISEISFKFLFLTSIPIAFFLSLYAKDILGLIYGYNEFFTDYQNLHYSIILLNLISLVIIIRFIATPYAMILTVKGDQSKRTLTVIMAAIINVTFNLIFIPLYGAYGSIIVSILTNLIAFICYVIFSKQVKFFKNANLLNSLLVVSLYWFLQYYFDLYIPFVINIIFILFYFLFGYLKLFSVEDKIIFHK